MVIAVLGLVVVAIAVLSFRAMITAGQQADDTTPDTHPITYEATSTGKTVVITYTQGSNGIDGQTAAPPPWKLATAVTANVATLTVTSGTDSRSPDRADSVTCAIVDTATGETLVRNAVPPSNGATVTCVASNLGA